MRQLASEIVIIDIIKEKAMGEAMDIRQATPFVGPISVRDGDYEDAKDSDIVIFTSGVGRKPGQSRLDLTQTNVDITKSVIPLITKACPNALYVIVANPVDILTYQFVKTSGIPANRIFGTGTLLDTARFRARIAETYKVGATNVHGYVFGEHGDSSFVPWSLANIGSIPVDNFAKSFTGPKLPDFDKNDVEDYINMRSRADHPFAFTGQRRQQFIEILKKESRAVHGTRTSRLNERILVLGKIL